MTRINGFYDAFFLYAINHDNLFDSRSVTISKHFHSETRFFPKRNYFMAVTYFPRTATGHHLHRRFTALEDFGQMNTSVTSLFRTSSEKVNSRANILNIGILLTFSYSMLLFIDFISQEKGFRFFKKHIRTGYTQTITR